MGTSGDHVRTLAKILVLVAAVAPVAWSGTYLYWRFKISRGARYEAGCRALPFAVAGLQPSRKLTDLLASTKFIRERVADGMPRFSSGTSADPDSFFLKTIDFEATDTMDVRAEKCRQWKEWWRASGGYYHQEWRVWSGRCR